MSDNKLIFGFDLGTTSIGWTALQRSETDFNTGQILGAGVRIFPATTEGTKDAPKNWKRRESRGARRLLKRKNRRRTQVRDLLIANGLLPPIDPANSAGEFDKLRDPYLLRARGLTEPLEPHQLGRAIYHLTRRRGFKSNRKATQSDDKKKEEGVVLDGIKHLRNEIAEIGAASLGEFLNAQGKKRGRYLHRDMIEAEFDALWAAQKKFHNGLLTDELRDALRGPSFFQRPLKVQRGLIGKCTFEPDKQRCDLARLQAQRFRYWQDLNHMQLQDRQSLNWRPLSGEEKQVLVAELEAKREVKFDRVRKLLKLGDESETRINLETHAKNLKGNSTNYLLHKVLGKNWDELAPDRQDRLVEELFRITEDDSIRKHFAATGQYDVETIEKLVGVSRQLEPGHSRLSLKAIRKLLPLMSEQGLKYWEAANEVYGDHRKRRGGVSAPQLPPPPRDLRNPVVTKTLHELRKVVNAMIETYGPPDEIRLEVARDLKLTKKQKEAVMKQQTANLKANREADEFFHAKFPDARVSGSDRLKYRLWKEAGERCVYTGDHIPPQTLLSDAWEIEHIIPYRRSFDDSYMNKTLCAARFNREIKRDRAPAEIYDRESNDFHELMQRVDCLPNGKRKKFEMTVDELRDFDQRDVWAGRQLSDTRYICREARGYLLQLFPYDNDENKYVRVVPGGATAKLRYSWGLNSLLADGDLDEKNRTDHRHHAIDAIVVALTDRALFQMIATVAGQNRERLRKVLDGMPHPWPSFRDDVKDILDSITVSHAPMRRIRGELLEETAYGPTYQPGVYVTKKALTSLTKPLIGRIVDNAVRELVQERVEQYGGDLKKAFAEPLYHRGNEKKLRKAPLPPIKKVRVFENKSPDTLLGIQDVTGRHYKFYALAGNHRVEIFEHPDTGERKVVLVPRLFAAQPQRVLSRPEAPWQFLFSLCRNDYFEFRHPDGRLAVYRVQKMSGGSAVDLIALPLNEARKEYITGVTLKLTGRSFRGITRKLLVDPLGRLSTAND